MGKTRKKFCPRRSLSGLGLFFIPNAKPWEKFNRFNIESGDSGGRLER
jgi:hypothetical protein